MSSSIDWKSLSAETQRRGITSRGLKPLGIYWSRGPPIKKPEKPGFSRFRKRMVPPLIRSSQAPSASATPAPELVTNEQAQSVEDLTAEARYQYGLMWTIFQHDAKQHEIQRVAVKELKTWILKTVRKLQPHVLPPQEELQTWKPPYHSRRQRALTGGSRKCN